MSTPETSSSVPPSLAPQTSGESSSPTARPIAGPLAKFTRSSSEGEAAELQEQSPPERPAPAAVPKAAPPIQRQSDQPSREVGGGDRPHRPRREQQRAEDAQVDRELANERKARQDTGPRPSVPVPNIRQKMDDIEAELEAALGGKSLEDIVAGGVAPQAGRLPNESKHRGQVIEVHGDNVFVSLGGKDQGVVSLRTFATAPAAGEMLDVTVTGYNSEDSLHDLMVPGGKIVIGDWSDIGEGSLVEATITAANTGGLECQVKALRGFIPASQVAMFRIENFGDYVGQKLVCVVTESNERRGNLVLSRRAVLEREKAESKEKLMAELEPGQMYEGTVRKLMDFGAFVDIGGVDGLIHISQMSWDRVKHPSEILKEGDKVRVRIERIDPESGKIGLSLKNPEEHPWTGIEQRFPVGTTVKGPVSRIAQFGAFVKLAPGVEGLIHISELAHYKVFKVENIVSEGQEVECKVLSVDAEAQRMSLSLKATLEKPVKASDKPKGEEPADEPPRAPAIPKRPGPLKGGSGKATGGEQFGLRW